MGIRDYIPRLRIGPERIPSNDLRVITRANAGDIFDARYNGDTNNAAVGAYANYYLQSTPAYAAVKLRADSVASAKLTIMRETQNGLEPVGYQHPVQEVFDRVNPWWTAADLWKATETHLSLYGSAFWFIDKDGENGTEIWPIRADRMQIIPGRKKRGGADMPNAYIAGYEFSANGRKVPLMTDEVMWFRYFNPLDEYAGASPVAPARLTLDMGRDALRFNRNFFSNGTNPGNLAFSTDQAYTDEQVDEFYKRLDQRFQGSSKSHRPFLLTNGLDAKNLGMTQRDMEFMSSLQYTVEDASRVWRVWPELLASGTRAAFRNVGEATADFWLSTVSNEWSFLESEVTELLMPLMGAQARGLVAAFDTSEVPALERARVEENRQNLEAVKAGAMTINEWREAQGMEPVAWGDVWWSPSSLFPVSEPDSTPPALAPLQLAQPTQRALPPPQTRKSFKVHVDEKQLRMDHAVDVFEKSLTRREQGFRAMMRSLFGDQMEEVKRNIRIIGVETVDGLAELFNMEESIQKWARRAEPLYEDAITGSARQTAVLWGLKPLQTALNQERIFNPLNPDDPGFKVWLQNRLRWWASRTNETTASLLQKEINASIASGEGIPEIMSRVDKVFDFSNAIRSERIARTEMVAAQNRGNLEIMKSSGVVEQKRWLTARDERVRESHSDVGSRGPIPIDEQFSVGSDMMDAPGQGSVAGENINCRCVVQPVVI